MASLSVFEPDSTGTHLGAEHLHAQHVRLLPLDVDRAHVDDAFQPELRAQGRGGDAVHAGAGLGDDARLAHALRQHDLAEHIVHLVRAGVVEVLALEIDLRAAEMRGQALGEIERRRPADIMREMAVHLALEGGIGLGRGVGLLQIEDQRHQRLGDEAAADRCRNGRARRARCGTSWAALDGHAPLATFARAGAGRLARGADEGADLVGVLHARRALDAGRHVDRRRAGDAQRLGDVRRHRARPTA